MNVNGKSKKIDVEEKEEEIKKRERKIEGEIVCVSVCERARVQCNGTFFFFPNPCTHFSFY
jgi:hypothetical protein